MACPKDIDDNTFVAKGLAVTGRFDVLSSYADDKPLFKIEDHNYALENGQLNKKRHEPLYAIAISAKRYVLSNINSQGHSVIRKALAHGLGHMLAPYREDKAPASIPVPVLSFSDIGVERWQYEFWYQIILAELEGHPDQVGLSSLPNLHLAAASRYSAASVPLQHWFDNFNKANPSVNR